MKAIVYDRYGSPEVLRLEERADPVPSDDEVLVRVRAAAANPYDWHFLRGLPYFMRLMIGLRAPKRERLGLDFAGRVEAVGRNVTRQKPGDEVYGMSDGAFAELLCASEKDLASKPGNLTFEQAAAVPLGATTALQGLRDAGRLEPGHRVLILGASGGVGTFAVQIAKQLGGHVTGVCSTGNLELVRSLGADEAIDYTREDFTEGDRRWDLILELAASRPLSRLRRALTREGRLVLSSGDSKNRWIGPLGRLIGAGTLSLFVSQKLGSLIVKRSREDLVHIAELVEAGKLTPVIDRTYPLAQVPEVIAHVETGHTRGKVVVTI